MTMPLVHTGHHRFGTATPSGHRHKMLLSHDILVLEPRGASLASIYSLTVSVPEVQR